MGDNRDFSSQHALCWGDPSHGSWGFVLLMSQAEDDKARSFQEPSPEGIKQDASENQGQDRVRGNRIGSRESQSTCPPGESVGHSGQAHPKAPHQGVASGTNLCHASNHLIPTVRRRLLTALISVPILASRSPRSRKIK